MNNWLSRQLYIFFIALIFLAQSIVLNIVLANNLIFRVDLYDAIYSCVYAFSILPSLNLVFDFVNKLTVDSATRMGFLLGITCGFIMFLLPLILAPIFMVINYYNVFKVIKNKIKAKNRNT